MAKKINEEEADPLTCRRCGDTIAEMDDHEPDGLHWTCEIEELKEERKRLKAAIRKLLKNPDGCTLCDSGVTRNPAKGHQPNCPFERAKALI